MFHITLKHYGDINMLVVIMILMKLCFMKFESENIDITSLIVDYDYSILYVVRIGNNIFFKFNFFLCFKNHFSYILKLLWTSLSLI